MIDGAFGVCRSHDTANSAVQTVQGQVL